MAFPLENFPHIQIIKKASIKVEELEDDLRILISSFVKKYNGYKLKESENALRELQALSNLISQNIYDYYVDKEDQEVEIEKNDPVTPAEVKEIVEDIKENEQGTIDNGQLKSEKPVNPPVPTPAPEPVVTPPAPDPQPDPQPAPQEDPEPANKNEKALFLLLKEGVTSGITRAMLKEKGFNTDLASIRGCRVGQYMLYKEFSETTYHLKKV